MREQSDMTTDVLGEPFLAETIELPDDDEGRVVATLVSRPAEGGTTGRAVLYVHGFCDYFFQTEVAHWWAARGYTFYGLDLRKYGRSMLPHQTPNFVTDLRQYGAELDEAMRRIRERDGHAEVVLTAHSTGGLITSLWAHDTKPEISALVLNSPWLDLNGNFLLRTAATTAIDQVGARRPYQAIPRNLSGLYAQSLHRDHSGEWEFDVTWKPIESFPVYAGWLRAIRRGHARLHRGIDVGAPVLLLSSARSAFPKVWDEDVDRSDIVLDVELMRRWAHKLGRHVTIAQVEDALHDVFLSRRDVRDRAYAEVDRWMRAYVEKD